MNFASTPNWVWIALAAAVGLHLYRNGWFDNLLKRLPSVQPAAPQQPAVPQIITFKHVIEQACATTSIQAAEEPKAPEPGSLPVIEKLTMKGPLKINVSEGGKVDVSA